MFTETNFCNQEDGKYLGFGVEIGGLIKIKSYLTSPNRLKRAEKKLKKMKKRIDSNAFFY